MVATQQKEIFRVFDFVGKQQANSFQRLFATVYIIAQK